MNIYYNKFVDERSLQVTMVRSQSNGKSNVLEALMGCNFLLKGLDICKR
jgi:hypothetical protein